MSSTKVYQKLGILLLALAVFINLLFSLTKVRWVLQNRPVRAQTQVQMTATKFQHYLPILFKRFPPKNVFGVEIHPPEAASVMIDDASNANTYWVRLNGLIWSDIEKTRGVWDWTPAANLESTIKSLTSLGLQPILIIRNTPSWAQSIPGYGCAPMQSRFLGDFADFVGEAVSRYSVPPFNVKYWEIWNEPDVDPAELHPGYDPFGCWGNHSDPYYGGGYFAQMLQLAYPAIKKSDPEAQVILGGLMLDCDPANPPQGKTCNSAYFLEGILANGGGEYFDIVAYHAYALWGAGEFDWDLEETKWQSRGGVTPGKLGFIHSVLSKYQANKPIIMNEGALLCEFLSCPATDYQEAKANYVIRRYSRAPAYGLIGSIWFTLNGPGWYDSGLLARLYPFAL